MRLDKFLKISRIIKRRSVAKEVADKGRIQINGKLANCMNRRKKKTLQKCMRSFQRKESQKMLDFYGIFS